ncbi:MAG: hypothetical protein ACREAA_07980 [Candidatus Polarisedimenticolia bacterium]
MILGLALVLAVPAAAVAQTQSPPTPSGDVKSVTCRVTNVNAGEKSFMADCPDGAMTFTTTPSTQFTRSTGASGGGTASMTDLKAGDQVRITFNAPAGGTATGTKPAATRVEIMPATGGGGASGSGSSGSGSGPQGVQTASQTSGQAAQKTATSSHSEQPQQPGQPANKVTGRVASVDRQNRTLFLETSKGREFFKIDPSITSVDFNSIREGEQVEILFQGTGAERRITSLRMMPDQMGQQGGQQPAQQPAKQPAQQPVQHASQRTGTAQQAGGSKVSGRVVSQNQNQLVIETASGRETFAVDPQQTSLNLASYRPGDQVQITYTGTGNEKKITSIKAVTEQRASQQGQQGGDAAPAGQHLPQTASEIPFIALAGLFMLAAAFGFRYVRRHV